MSPYIIHHHIPKYILNVLTSLHFYCHYSSPSDHYLSPGLFIIALGHILQILLFILKTSEVVKLKQTKNRYYHSSIKTPSINSPCTSEQNSNCQTLYILTCLFLSNFIPVLCSSLYFSDTGLLSVLPVSQNPFCLRAFAHAGSSTWNAFLHFLPS